MTAWVKFDVENSGATSEVPQLGHCCKVVHFDWLCLPHSYKPRGFRITISIDYFIRYDSTTDMSWAVLVISLQHNITMFGLFVMRFVHYGVYNNYRVYYVCLIYTTVGLCAPPKSAHECIISSKIILFLIRNMFQLWTFWIANYYKNNIYQMCVRVCVIFFYNPEHLN